MALMAKEGIKTIEEVKLLVTEADFNKMLTIHNENKEFFSWIGGESDYKKFIENLLGKIISTKQKVLCETKLLENGNSHGTVYVVKSTQAYELPLELQITDLTNKASITPKSITVACLDDVPNVDDLVSFDANSRTMQFKPAINNRSLSAELTVTASGKEYTYSFYILSKEDASILPLVKMTESNYAKAIMTMQASDSKIMHNLAFTLRNSDSSKTCAKNQNSYY
jgi:hypothetical protein